VRSAAAPCHSPRLSFDGEPRYAIAIEHKDCWVVTITITDSANPLTSEMHIREFGSLIKALDFLARRSQLIISNRAEGYLKAGLPA
jgi:hypothetical protein